MSDPAADMLVARLLWPAPQIRWEAGRAIAALVRAGHAGARDSLVAWIGRRALESEVVLGLGVIDAFRLGAHFDPAELGAAIRAPSLLSDWLLARNFTGGEGLDPVRYQYAPPGSVDLPASVGAAFNQSRRWGVSLMFGERLAGLQQATGVPLLRRWEHEWRWLQHREERPIGVYPRYFFSEASRDELGPYDGAQSEIYASAFLRTLHWAMWKHGAPRDTVEMYALDALTMNRGLADIAPLVRPRWAHAAFPASPDPVAETRRIWEKAAASVGRNERVIALDFVDTAELGFADYRFRLAAVPPGWQRGTEPPARLREITLGTEAGSLTGIAGTRASEALIEIGGPFELVQKIVPNGMGRTHIDVVTQLSILSPYLAGSPLRVEARADQMVAYKGRLPVSRWRYWHAGWTPASPAAMRTRVPSMTTAPSDVLAGCAERNKVDFGLWVDTLHGMRKNDYSDMQVERQSLWLTYRG